MQRLLLNKKIPIFFLSMIMVFSLFIGLTMVVKSAKAVVPEKEVLTSSADGSQFAYATDANGWSTYVQSATGVTWNNANGERVISSSFGIEGKWDHLGDSGMTLNNNGYNANFTAFDVTKPIRLQYMLHPYRTGDYNFALFDNLSTALKAGNSTWNGGAVGAKIWMRGANQDLIQDIVVNNQAQACQLNSRLLFNSSLYYNSPVLPNPYTVDTYRNKYVDVVFVIGPKATTIMVDGNYVGVLNVKRSDFASGYAYMTVANAWSTNGTYIAVIAKAISQDPVFPFEAYSTADGSAFTFGQDANGWTSYKQNLGVQWNDLSGAKKVGPTFGREGPWTYNQYSGLTLLNNAHVINYTPLDVTKPIQIEYMQHAARSGDYTFALFDSLEGAFSATNGSWNGSSVGAKIWMRGSNTDLVQGAYQLNSHILFNASLYCDKLVLPNPYNSDTCLNKSVVITLAIGEANTKVAVDGEYIGTLNVKRSDFANGVAYLSLANAWSKGAFSAILVKAPKQDGVSVDINNEITSMSVSINDGLSINAHATLFEECVNPEMTFEFNGETEVVSNYVKQANNGKSKYSFTYSGLTPQFMNKEIKMTLTAEINGVRQTIDTKTTTVRDYAMKILNSTETLTTEKSMAIDLLNYGALAQQYAKQDVDDLANKLVTEKHKANGSTFNADKITSVKQGINSEEITWDTAKLVLADTVGIRFELSIKEGLVKENVTIKATLKGQATTYNLQEHGGIYYIVCTGIAPSEYDETIVLTAFVNGVQTEATMTYSVNSWIKAKYNDEKDSELAKALYIYGNSANVFVESSFVGGKEVESPRVMNTTTSNNQIVTSSDRTLAFDSGLWQTPETMRYTGFDQPNSASKGYFITMPFGNNYKFFVYVGIPANASATNKVPGMVLVHGGGGTAFYEWVDAWVARGYAAIAMCTDNNVPTLNPANSPMRSGGGYTTCNQFTANGVTFNVGPANSGYFNDYNLPFEQQWGYNAIAKVIMSNSFLRSFEGVDTNRIGITGISYGSILTCQAVGYDDRYVCAVPVYGAYCQDVGVNNRWPSYVFGDKYLEKGELYNNYQLLENNKTPFLFVNGNVDPGFSILSQTESVKRIPESKMLIHNGLPHGHEVGANLALTSSSVAVIPEVFAFVDSICLGTARLPEITVHPTAQSKALQYSLAPGASIVSAIMLYTDSPSDNDTAVWYTASCKIEGNKVIIPNIDSAYYFYVNIKDSNGNRVSSHVVKDNNWTSELLTEYVRPFWSSNKVFNESGVFIGETGSFNLLYTPTKITMVGQYYDTEIEYVEGVDYTVSGNVITRLVGSRMPYWKVEEYYSDEPANITFDSTMTNNPISLQMPSVDQINQHGGTIYNPDSITYATKYIPYTTDGAANIQQRKFIMVSYEHEGNMDDLVLVDDSAKMAIFHSRVKNIAVNDIRVLVIGTSLGEGCSASGTKYAGHVGLDAPDLFNLMAQWISKHENKKISITNISIGGSVAKNWTKTGVGDNKDAYSKLINALRRTGDYLSYGVDRGENVANNYYDLIINTVGGNDGGTSEADFKAYYKEVLDTILTYSPNACILNMSPSIGNELCPAWNLWTNKPRVVQWIQDVINSHAKASQLGFADHWTPALYTLARGKYGKDYLTNNINHGGDYLHRWYAQVNLYAMYGDEYINSFN